MMVERAGFSRWVHCSLDQNDNCIFGGSVLTRLEVSVPNKPYRQDVCDIVLLSPSDTWLGCHNPEQQHESVIWSLRLAGTFADHPLEPLAKAGWAGAACPGNQLFLGRFCHCPDFTDGQGRPWAVTWLRYLEGGCSWWGWEGEEGLGAARHICLCLLIFSRAPGSSGAVFLLRNFFFSGIKVTKVC